MPESKLAKWFPGRAIGYARGKTRLSQNDVGEFLGKNYQTYARIEQGKTCPSVGDCFALANLFNLSDELRDYMIHIARNDAQQNFENDRRFNALCLQMAELSYGVIYKWEPLFIPGIAQIRAYHFDYLRLTQDYTDQQLNRGWSFKKEREEGLLQRTDRPTVVLLISETALHNLRFLSKLARREQLARLRELDALPGWEIRIVSALHPEGGGAFEIYRPGKAEFGGPPFVYSELWDNSWCIEDPSRIERYDELWKILWIRSTALKEYLDDRRDGLA